MVYEVRGVVLPERTSLRFWIESGKIRLSRPAGEIELVVDRGWIIPGLVDVHTHPGTEKPGDVFDDEALRRHLAAHRDSGVLAIRTPGTAARMPAWVADDMGLPRVVSAGYWLATPGRFFEGYGRDVKENELVAACVEESRASGGWCKIIGDWRFDEPPVPLELLAAAAEAVHAVGGRLAVHCQTAEGSRNAVLAKADSVEHGMHLDPALLDQMATQGTALIPTMVASASNEETVRAREPSPSREWWISGWEGKRSTVRAANEAGVLVLAGTDSLPFGNIAEEVAWLIKAGLPAEQALGAASWKARSWLNLPGLEDGAPADFVVYDSDPIEKPDILRHPSRIVLSGVIIK